jgi:O-antigen ligase
MLSSPGCDSATVTTFARWLFRIAIAAAAFACADFYFQFPSPAGFGPQFVWLDNEVLRRAQGLFYEASTLGNFCAFFLVFAMVAFFYDRKARPCGRFELVLGAIVLAAALVFSYSRASLLNLLCGSAAFLLLPSKIRKRFLLRAAALALAVIGVIWAVFPAYWSNYWTRLQTSVLYFNSAPGAVLSGRLSSWSTLSQFGIDHPAELILGIGYKTLPYSEHVGVSTIADNTYLDLLVETGIVGLTVFLALNFELLRISWRSTRRGNSIQNLLSRVFFCFWIGETVQMLSGDLITYWRVLPIYLWALGAGLQRPEKDLS